MPKYVYFPDPNSEDYLKVDLEAATLLMERPYRLYKTARGNYVQQTHSGNYTLLEPRDALETLDMRDAKLTEAGDQERVRLLDELSLEV